MNTRNEKWEVVLGKDGRYRVTPTSPSQPAIICEMIRVENTMDYTDEMVLANAKRIAASPDLLEACKAFLEAQDSPAPRDLLTLAAIQASGAIAKATA